MVRDLGQERRQEEEEEEEQRGGEGVRKGLRPTSPTFIYSTAYSQLTSEGAPPS